MKARNPEKYEAFLKWRDEDPLVREPKSQQGLALALGVTEQTITNWNRALRTIEMEGESVAAWKHFKGQALKSNPSPQVLLKYLETLGIIKEEKTITHKFELSGDEYYRIRNDAIAQSRAIPGGDEGVREGDGGLPLLLESVRMDTEQEHSPDS